MISISGASWLIRSSSAGKVLALGEVPLDRNASPSLPVLRRRYHSLPSPRNILPFHLQIRALFDLFSGPFRHAARLAFPRLSLLRSAMDYDFSWQIPSRWSAARPAKPHHRPRQPLAESLPHGFARRPPNRIRLYRCGRSPTRRRSPSIRVPHGSRALQRIRRAPSRPLGSLSRPQGNRLSLTSHHGPALSWHRRYRTPPRRCSSRRASQDLL